MARYSRRVGPPSDHEITAALVTIPGLTITRFFDDGELLILATVQMTSAPGTGFHFAAYRLLLDGILLPGTDQQTTQGDNLPISQTIHTLAPVTRGPHTIEVQVSGTATVGDIAPTNRSTLTLIQLPQWDQDTDII